MSAASDLPTTPTAEPTGAPHILIVEDDDLDFCVTELVLREVRNDAGYRIERAESVADAGAAVSRTPPDLVLLDLSLPDAGGLAAFEAVQRLAGDAPILAMLERDDDDLALRLIRAGAEECLSKSRRSPQAIVRSVRAALARAEAHRELAGARRAAEQASHAKSAFVAAMSHEIRTPLTAILGMADLLAGTALTVDQREYVEIFRRAGRGLLDLLDNVLEIARIEAGRFEIARDPYDLAELVEDTIEVYAFTAHRKHLAIVADVASSLPRQILGDGPRMREVIVNLIGNAVKFTEKGHVLVQVDAEGGGTSGTLRIAVHDTGPGIPAAERGRIFERFEQAGSGRSARQPGTGLGLALCRELVERMGGTIEASDRPSGGASLVVRMPFEAVPKPCVDRPRPLAGRRVLLVDDDGLERGSTARALRHEGARVDTARSAAEADRAMRERGPYHAVVLDSRMPLRGGLDLGADWRREGLPLPTVVVMLMMDHRASDRQTAAALGFSVVMKPVRRRALVDALLRERVAAPPAPALHADELTGVRVLLAEDCPENRLVVRAFLRSTGARLRCALTGEEALAVRRSDELDVILMDLQMPEMDGLEATRRIRAWERATGRPRIPIVALTAHAYAESAREAEAAGCDLHVSKPFDRDTLIGVLRRFACPDAPPADTAAPPPVPAEADPELADLVPEYLERRHDELLVLDRALDAGDLATVRVLGHRMRGSGAAYGFRRITELGAALEHAARHRDPEAARGAARQLREHLVSLAPAGAAPRGLSEPASAPS